MKKKLLALLLNLTLIVMACFPLSLVANAEEPEIVYFNLGYNTSSLFQVTTSIEKGSVSGGNFLINENFAGVCPRWVTWDESTDDIIWTFTYYDGDTNVGDTFTLSKAKTFEFGGKTFGLDRSYHFERTATGWKMTTFDLPEDETTPLEFKSAGYGTESLLQVYTDIATSYPSEVDVYPGNNDADVYLDTTGDTSVRLIQFYADRPDGLICLQWTNALTAGQSITLNKGSVLRAGNDVYTLKYGYKISFDGSNYTITTLYDDINLQYRWGNANTIQYNTGIDFVSGMTNFTATDFGCNLLQSGDQQLGWAGVNNVDGKLVLSFNFNGNFTKGQGYTLSAGSLFCFMNGGTKYSTTGDITVYFNGTDWQTTPLTNDSLTLTYRYGTNNVIMYNTDLPSDTPIANFLVSDNGCQISESGSQNVGYIEMLNADGTIVLAFHFNNAMQTRDEYTIGANSCFAFTNGLKYYTDTANTLYFNGNDWQSEKPKLPLTLSYRPSGFSNTADSCYIQFNTNLPATTPLVNFLTSDNGNVITETGSSKAVGWIGMDNADGVIVLTFHFSGTFNAKNTYKIAKNSVFNFTDGNSYILENDCDYTFAGNNWQKTSTIPADSSTLGDINGDGNVNILDLIYLKNVAGQTKIGNNQVDLNSDNSVDAVDLTIIVKILLGTYTGEEAEYSAEVLSKLSTAKFGNSAEFGVYADVPVDGRSAEDIEDYKALGMNTAIITEDYAGSIKSAYSIEVSKNNEKTVSNLLTLTYTGYTTGKMIQIATNLPADGTYANFLAEDQNLQYVGTRPGYFQCSYDTNSDKVYINPIFNDYYNVGDTFVLKQGSVFTFGGISYTLDADYTFTFRNSYVESIQNLHNSGLKVIVRNHTNKSDYFDADTTAILKKYSDIIDGFYMNDEPFATEALQTASGQTSVTTFAGVTSLRDWMNENFAGKYLHVNHVPITSYDHYEGDQSIANYQSFLTSYLNTCVTGLNASSGASLSLDAYPFGDYTKTSGFWIFKTTTQGLNSKYLQSVLAAANVARDYSANTRPVDFTNCVQTFTSGSGRVVNADEISFQLYTSMAMGVKRFEYFTYRSVNDIVGMIDTSNNKTSIYTSALTANKALALGKVLNGFTWKGTALSNGSVNNTSSETFSSVSSLALTTGTNTGVLSSVSSTDDAIIGYYKTSDNLDAYMVANYNDPHDVATNNSITVSFNNCTAARIYTVDANGNLTTQLVHLSNGAYTLSVAPGSGMIIIPA